jgi:(R,R)-butanediol dehydrogenase/meso-butanediol dehydrogenase/diacetyl reductase
VKAIRYLKPGAPLALAEMPDPAPGPGEVVLRIARCGICGSDLEMTSGKGAGIEPGCTLGHEFAGEVVALGSGVGDLQIGSRVTAMPFDGCGTCDRCMAGRPNHCRELRVHGCGGRGGGYAEYSLASARHCIELPDSLGFEDGALIEPLAVALHGARMAGALAGKRVLVLGAGPIGLAATWWARRLGAGPIATAAATDRRRSLAQHLGADAFVVAGDHAADAVVEALGGPAEIVLECAGKPGLLDDAVRHAGLDAQIIVMGYCVTPDTFFQPPAIRQEVMLRFAKMYTHADFADTVAALASGNFEPRAMITRSISLDAVPLEFERLRTDRSDCKVMIIP